MTPFDIYEISPCRRYNDAGDPDPNGLTYEVCEPNEADLWTLYGHIPGEGVMAIGDFDTREHAEEAFQRITGILYAGTREVQDRIRVMHAGPRLLGVLSMMVRWTEMHGLNMADLINGQRAEVPVVTIARKAIAEATTGQEV